MFPELYQKHLTTQLNKAPYLILSILVQLLQSYRWVRLEELANKFPQPILFESRRKKLQRFFLKDTASHIDLPSLTIETIWLPIFKDWLNQRFTKEEVLYIAIDRTRWGLINLLMVSLIINHRAIPIYFELLDHKWKRKYRGWTADEGWFILSNLNSLSESLEAYQKRFGIEEMFRDFKSGGYNLEGTKVEEKRLMTLILLITLAYSQATLCGEIIKNKGIAKYVGRVKEKGRKYPRHSNFYLGLHAIAWVESIQFFAVEIRELMKLSPQKCANYHRGLRAAKLMVSTL